MKKDEGVVVAKRSCSGRDSSSYLIENGSKACWAKREKGGGVPFHSVIRN